MKRILITLIMALFVCTSSNANILIGWSASGGFYWSADTSTGFLGDGSGQSALAQLIWSPDNAVSPALPGVDLVSEGELVLSTYTLTEDGVAGNFDEWGTFTGTPATGADKTTGTPSPLGYVYGRIFQNASPGVGDWYYAGPVDSVLSKAPTDSVQVYSLTRDFGAGDAIDGNFGAQVVPEPGTFVLFGLGAALVAARRRRG